MTYINSHGVHQLLTNNINAPLPGTYCASTDPTCTPSPGVRPYGNIGDVYQYQSVGIYNENQIIANFNVRAGARLNLFGFYTLSYANGDTGGVNSFPMNPYNIREDYGPSAFAVRNRFFVGGSFGAPYGLQISPFLVAASGQPYNITLGQDLNGDSIYNDRPAFAAAAATGDLRLVGTLAHKLKSSSRSVGALALGDLCAGLENAGKGGGTATIAQEMQEFKAAMAAVGEEIRELLAGG